VGQEKKVKSIYQEEKPAIQPRRSKLKSQNELMDYWNEKFQEMIKELKLEIMEVIDE
jgi:hypothetical protein